MRLTFVSVVSLVAFAACGGGGAPSVVTSPPAEPPRPPPKVVEMGEFTVELPAGPWQPYGEVAAMTLEIPRTAGIDHAGGGFALVDRQRDVYVHGFDGQSAGGEPDTAALVDKLHAGADTAFAGSWNVTERVPYSAAGERRMTVAGDDTHGLSMRALVLTIVENGVVHGVGVQCVYAKARAAEGAGVCDAILGSLRRISPASSAAPSGRSS